MQGAYKMKQDKSRTIGGKKSKKKVSTEEAPKKARLTCISFLKDLYEGDKEISNDKALNKLLKKFPNSKAGVKSIITWKNMLRNVGVDIPLNRVAKVEKPKKADKVTKEKKKKSKSKKSKK